MVTNFEQPVVHGRVRTLDENAPALAQGFTTGGDRGHFEATRIGFKVAAVNEVDGFDVTAGLYTANASGRRGSKIAELVAPTPITAYRRNYWEVPDGIILEPDTSYFVVLRCDLGSTDAEICNGGEYIRIRAVVDDDEDDVDHGVDEGLFDGWSIADNGYGGVWGGLTSDDASHAMEVKGYSARIPYIIDNGVTVTSTPGDGGDSYSYGETIEITVRLSRAILVDYDDPIVIENSIGIVITLDRPLYPDLAPSLRFRLGDPGEAQDRYAHYAGGDYTNTLIFHYIVTSGDSDSDGIEIPGGDDAFGHNLPRAFQGDTTRVIANLEFPALGVQTDHKVDSTPKIDTVNLAEPIRITSVPAIGTTYRNREVVEVTVTFDQPVLVTPPVQASIGIDGGSGPKWRGAAYSHGSGTESVAFQYVVVQDDSDTDGIEIYSNLLAQGGDPDHIGGVQGSGDITSLGGNLAVNLASSGVPDDSGHKVDGSMSGRHVEVVPKKLAVGEGDSAGYMVWLTKEPTGSVTVTVDGFSGTDVSVDSASLTFTTLDWSTNQTVTVTAGQDDDIEPDEVTLTHTVAGGGYGSAAADDVTVTVRDNDRQGVTVSAMALTVPEGGTAEYTVVLSAEPAKDVTVKVTGASGDVSIDGDRVLTFTSVNWNDPQTVTVRAAEDDDAVADDPVTLTNALAGGGSARVTVTVTENDTTRATVTIGGLSNATTPENAAWTSPSPTATGGIGAVTWSKSGADAGLFTQASDGRLTLGAQDYEAPADADNDNVYEATVVATDADQNTDGQSIEVTVTDVIETSAVTIGGLSNATTPENAAWTSPVPTAAGAIGAVTWSKSGADAGLFTQGSDGRLTLGAQDYETPADADADGVYEVTLHAVDADANEDTHSLEVTVTDVVETATVTIGGLSNATTPENAAWTSPSPTATGAIGAVTWSKSGADAALFTQASDGGLTLGAQDYESPADADGDNVYEATVVAMDADGNTDTHSLEVTVTDVIETSAVTIGGLSNATTPENVVWTSPMPTASGAIGAVTWTKSGADAGLFTLASDGRLTLLAQDYEAPADADADGVYEVTLRAVDADANEDTHSLEVTVTDVVETATVTIGGLSNATTPENAAWTSPSPTATGGIGAVTWSKSGADAALFTLASDGRLTLGAQDYETPADADADGVYAVTLHAVDADANEDTHSLEVTVTDVVETATVTIGGLSNATTPENAAWTSPSPTATGGIGAVTWSKSGADAALFTQASDGQLTLGAQDYEAPADADGDNVYEATVVATDADQNTDGQSIEVTVTDVVETATVTIGGLSNATAPENSTWTSPIPTAAGAIGAVTWSKSGTDAALFTLASDGRLTLPAQDYEAPADVNLDNAYQVTVRAEDVDANAAQVSITISVTDSTETSTVTVGGLSDASTAENAAWTSPVPTAVGAIGAVTWTKSGPDAGLFTQAPDGRLTLGAQDYETHADANADNVYEVTPTATDGDGNVGARSIGVVVTDVVETSTVTIGGLSNATTPENSTWTSPAPTASGAIGAVTWGKSGADAALFTQASDGRLTLGAQDYETPADANADNVYAVTVTATDADDNVGAHTLEVQVTNVFDDTPLVRFGASSYTAKEGGADARVRVELSEAVVSPVTIPLIPTNRGGATNADYSGVPPNVTFGASETSKTFTVTATDDSVDDNGESVRIGFGTLPSTVESGSRTKTTVHLQDNDGLSVSFGKTFYKTREGGEPATVKVQLNRAPGSSLTIPLTTEHRNWATAADYSGVPPSVTFGPSERVRTFTVTVERDNDIEDAEELRIGFGALPPGVVAGSPAWTSVALEDDLSVAFGAASYTAAEGGAGVTVTVRLTKSWGAPFTLPLTVQWHGGASTSDYTGIPGSVMFRGEETTQTFTVTAVDDAVNDDGESVEIGFGWPRPQPVWTGVPSTATVELVDNDNAQQEGALRLTQGAGVNGGSSGRLQVYHDGRWGLVCDTNFDELDARVACRQLGFADGEEGYADAGSGGLPFWLKGLACDGTESRLANCPHRGLKEYSCGSFRIVGLECSRTPLSMTDARVRGALLTLSYDAALDGGSAPSGRDFVVTASPPDGASAVPVPVTSVAVDGEAVSLTLARPVLPDERVRLSYLVAPMHPVQDTSGSRAAPLADLAVRNATRIAAPRRLEAAAAAASPGAATALPVSGPAPEAREPLDLSPWLADGGASAPLGRLDLSSRTISDIDALAGLTALRALRLEDNGVVDLGPLSALTGLRVLDLSSNAIADVGPLSALMELERLNLSGNRIADVSALSGLKGLKVLLLHGNRIDDVLPLWSLQGLLHLGLAGNRVADIGLLAELASLQRLDLTGNRVSDVSPLGDLSRLVWLRLAGNPVAELSPLGRLTLLRWLWLDAGVAGREALKAPGRANGTPLWIEGVPARQRNGEQ